MKLNINKVCDLSSISVLPPHARRLNAMNSGADASGFGGNQASQRRSLSQQSFSQGFSQSQISQNSFEENLGNDQKFDYQEREKSSKKISSLAPVLATRDESQMPLSRTSNNVVRRWSMATPSDNRCQVSEELERRLRLLESSLSKLGMILDSLQSDVMQINRAVKEVSLEMEATRQKTNLLDNTMHQVLKEEEDIKALLDRNMKLISDQMMKEADRNRLNEITSAIPAFPKQIETKLMEFRHEICVIISKNMQVLANNMRSFMDNLPDAILSREAKICIPTRRQQNSQTSNFEIPVISPLGHKRWDAVFNKEEALEVLKPKMTNYSKSATIKHEEILPIPQEQILIESDEESGGSLCCILVRKETAALRKDYNSECEFPGNTELPERPLEPVCAFYAKTGKCKFGANCKFHHPKDIQMQAAGKDTDSIEKNQPITNNYDVSSGDSKHMRTFVPFTPALLHNTKGLPIRPGETDCPFYLKTGSCKYGATCRYNYPDLNCMSFTTITAFSLGSCFFLCFSIVVVWLGSSAVMGNSLAATLSNAIITPTAASLPIGVINSSSSLLPSMDPRLAQLGLGPAIYPQRLGEIECDVIKV